MQAPALRPVRSFRQIFPNALTIAAVVGLTTVTASWAQEVRFVWQPSGIGKQLGSYIPQRLILKREAPQSLKKSPRDLASPLYGEIKVGPREAQSTRLVILDEPADKPPRLFVDSNGNGDLTDDTPVEWNERKVGPPASPTVIRMGEASAAIPLGNTAVDGRFTLYRFDKNDPTRAALADSIFYYRDFGLKGELILNGKPYQGLLVDESSAGDFRGKDDPKFSGVRLMVDVNGDGQFDYRREGYDVKKPFNIGGTTWELAGMTAAGKFSIAKSSQTAEEIKPAPNLTPGAKVPAFTAKTTTGKTVSFPADYKGKVVLLDFWATWCGPCLMELPNVLDNYSKYNPKGFEILGVSLDRDLSTLSSFTKEKGMRWSQVFDGKMWQTEQVQLYGVEGIPFMLIVDGDSGEILSGPEARGEALGPAIESALAKRKRSK